MEQHRRYYDSETNAVHFSRESQPALTESGERPRGRRGHLGGHGRTTTLPCLLLLLAAAARPAGRGRPGRGGADCAGRALLLGGGGVAVGAAVLPGRPVAVGGRHRRFIVVVVVDHEVLVGLALLSSAAAGDGVVLLLLELLGLGRSVSVVGVLGREGLALKGSEKKGTLNISSE